MNLSKKLYNILIMCISRDEIHQIGLKNIKIEKAKKKKYSVYYFKCTVQLNI